jgi:hypothetical protein
MLHHHSYLNLTIKLVYTVNTDGLEITFCGWCPVPPGVVYLTLLASVHLVKAMKQHTHAVLLHQPQEDHENEGWHREHTAKHGLLQTMERLGTLCHAEVSPSV